MDVAGILRWTELPRLARAVAVRNAQTANHAEMARTIGLPATTLTRYMRLLQALFLIEEVAPWSTNVGKCVARRPKLVVSDTGLATALLGMTTETWDADLPIPARGPLVESFVAMEIGKQLGWSATPATLHHYREHDGVAVDLLPEARDGRIVAIEVKAGHRGGARRRPPPRAVARRPRRPLRTRPRPAHGRDRGTHDGQDLGATGPRVVDGRRGCACQRRAPAQRVVPAH